MQYRIKEGAPTHYQAGRLLGPGDIIELPEGAKGEWIEPVVEAPKRGRPKKEQEDDSSGA